MKRIPWIFIAFCLLDLWIIRVQGGFLPGFINGVMLGAGGVGLDFLRWELNK